MLPIQQPTAGVGFLTANCQTSQLTPSAQQALSQAASVELLLRSGGCADLLDAPPPAAIEAVELCGRLPLALGVAGGIIQELGNEWEAELVPLLQDELGGEAESVEERVVTASLRVVPEAMRSVVEKLFTVFASFAEDAVIPAPVIDAVAPLMKKAGGDGAKHPFGGPGHCLFRGQLLG